MKKKARTVKVGAKGAVNPLKKRREMSIYIEDPTWRGYQKLANKSGMSMAELTCKLIRGYVSETLIDTRELMIFFDRAEALGLKFKDAKIRKGSIRATGPHRRGRHSLPK